MCATSIHFARIQTLVSVCVCQQVLIKTASGEWQAVQLQEAVTPTQMTTVTTPTILNAATAVASNAQKRTLAGARKERTLPKIAPAGGLIALNQLSSAVQAVQTININGVQVQGVPVTITNAGGQLEFPQLCDTTEGAATADEVEI